ncbi:LuxR family quorum-sensing system transcriptional regulator CciR [Sphingomonas zeicaulis]
MGIRYFALSQHVDFSRTPSGVRLHNYPAGWQDWYDAHGLGLSDPVHRASYRTGRSFLWRDIPHLLSLTRKDRALLRRSREAGFGEGVTVPHHLPGALCGSCTFVTHAGFSLPDGALEWTQMIGAFAFDTARRIGEHSTPPPPRISDRQRECVVLGGRGMTNRAIAKRLGIAEHSVNEHLREARQKLGVSTKAELAVRLLGYGLICIDDLWQRQELESRANRVRMLGFSP